MASPPVLHIGDMSNKSSKKLCPKYLHDWLYKCKLHPLSARALAHRRYCIAHFSSNITQLFRSLLSLNCICIMAHACLY